MSENRVQSFSKVSILVAARNEADNILDCLRALDNLSYPKESLQILIGDDASEDNTSQIIASFIENKPHFQLFKLPENSASALKGKTRVLAHLAQYATGEYLFFTDADIEVPPHWVENMLVHFKPNVGVVTGITTMNPKPKYWGLGGFQGLEWLYYLSLVRLFSLFGIPLTAMGNNMATTHEAYKTVGGYEKIGFSITEDYALFRAILAKGYDFVQLFDRRVLTISKPILSFRPLLTQRKRWMYGAMELPWGQRLGVYLNGFLLPILLILGVLTPQLALLLAVVSYIFTTAWLTGAIQWLSLRTFFVLIPFFWFYHVFMNFAMLVNFYLQPKTIWKGRQY
ncbi:MAG: glycosyltransferase [Runella sp.]